MKFRPIEAPILPGVTIHTPSLGFFSLGPQSLGHPCFSAEGEYRETIAARDAPPESVYGTILVFGIPPPGSIDLPDGGIEWSSWPDHIGKALLVGSIFALRNAKILFRGQFATPMYKYELRN
jgi:hypothetical protein